jgi:DNA-binding winged helix-turn-helix (wHTH) protein/TolB-like protein/Tfp pilus assembly protein PilF
MAVSANHVYEFGDFRLIPEDNLLLRDGESVALPPKAFSTLVLLLENHGHLVRKEELIEKIWADSFVDEAAVSRCVWMIRHALGEDSKSQRFIQTVPKCGYRFVAEVNRVGQTGGTEPKQPELTRSGAHAVVSLADWRELEEHKASTTNRGSAEAVGNLKLAAKPRPLESGSVIPMSPVESQPRQSFNKRLNWKLLTVAAVVISAAFIVFLLTAGLVPPMTTRDAAIDSIAVLPFTNAADPNSEYLSEGIAENLIDRLSRLPNVKVLSRSVVSRYKDKNIETIGDELKVKALLTGELVQRDDRILLSVELINATDNSRLWGARYDRKLTELLAVQTEIGQKVIERLNLNLTSEQLQSFNKRYTQNAQAYQFYLKGRHLWNKRTSENLRRAVDFFNQAVAADPDYAPAYAGLADCFALYSSYEIASGADSFPKAKAMALKALALDETLAEAHTSLAFVLYRFEWNWADAEREFKRAIELNPNYATAHHWYGEYLAVTGRFDEAFAQLQNALVLDPSSFIIHVDFGWSYYLARRYDDALAEYQKARAIERESPIVDFNSYGAYEQAGRYTEAADVYVAAMRADGFSTEQIGSLKGILQTSGYKAFKRAALEMRMQKYRLSSIEIASNRAFLGERDEAFTLLEKSIQDQDGDLVYLKFHPGLENLHDDPRFDGLVNRIGLSNVQ